MLGYSCHPTKIPAHLRWQCEFVFLLRVFFIWSPFGQILTNGVLIGFLVKYPCFHSSSLQSRLLDEEWRFLVYFKDDKRVEKWSRKEENKLCVSQVTIGAAWPYCHLGAMGRYSQHTLQSPFQAVWKPGICQMSQSLVYFERKLHYPLVWAMYRKNSFWLPEFSKLLAVGKESPWPRNNKGVGIQAGHH